MPTIKSNNYFNAPTLQYKCKFFLGTFCLICRAGFIPLLRPTR